jgi:hypothetical protein
LEQGRSEQTSHPKDLASGLPLFLYIHIRVLLVDNEGVEVILQRMDLFDGENNNKKIHFEIFIKMNNLDQLFLS